MPLFQTRYGPILGRISDFSRGEFGAVGPRRAQPGQFTGTNVVVYLDGSIGPRAGLRNAQPGTGGDGVPSSILIVGRQRALGDTLWVIDEDGAVWATAYPSGPGAGWHLYDNPVALSDGSSSFVDAVDDGTYTYFTSAGEESYRLLHDANQVQSLPGSPGGRAITIFGERLVVGGIVGAANQIRFTDANDYDSWPSLNFIELGRSNDIIKSLTVQRNVMLVTMENGDIYTISGTLSVNEEVRQFTAIAPREAAINAQRVSITKRGIVWRRGRNAVPESFDGSQLRSLPYLNAWNLIDPDTADFACCEGADDDDFLIFGSFGAALQLHNGAWTQHTLGIRNGDGDIDAFPGIYCTYDGRETVVVATNMQNGIPAFYDLALALERPPCVGRGDTVEDFGTGHAPVAGFSTPELRDSAGRGMTPRAIVIRFTKYSTGGVDTNHFEVSINLPDVYENVQQPPIEAPVFDEDPALATIDGVRQQIEFPVDTSSDLGAASITVSNIRGVQIDEIIVYGKIEQVRST